MNNDNLNRKLLGLWVRTAFLCALTVLAWFISDKKDALFASVAGVLCLVVVLVFLWVELRSLRDDMVAAEAAEKKPESLRSNKIVNDLANLTPEEKARLGWLIRWSMDGPEQGFLTNAGVMSCQIELADYLKTQGIHIEGQMLNYARTQFEHQCQIEKLPPGYQVQ